MSHLSTLATQMAHKGLVLAALNALGVPVQERAENGHLDIKTFYLDTTTGSNYAPVDLALGDPRWDYRMGLRQNAAGCYELIGDIWGVGTTPEGKAMLERLGPGFSKWKMERVNGVEGHVAATTPTRFLMEYVVQTGIWLAQSRGMTITEVQGDVSSLPQSTQNLLGRAQPGARKLMLRGGSLPGHMVMILFANPDGTSAVAFDGATDGSCYQFTKPLEDALGGVILQDVSTLETCHVGQQNRHIARNTR